MKPLFLLGILGSKATSYDPVMEEWYYDTNTYRATVLPEVKTKLMVGLIP